MQPFKKLSVWRKAHELAIRVYAATGPLLSARQFALASQLRRSAQSIPANIAVGSGQTTSLEFVAFLQVAIAFARELDYHLLLARDLDLLGSSDHAALEARTDEVLKMLVALRRTADGRPGNQRSAAAGKARGRPLRE